MLRRETRHRHQTIDVTEPSHDGHAGTVETQLLLRGLPLDQRQAFVLTQLLGLTYDEAAEVAGCRVGTIRSRVFRARERLVATLTEVDLELADAH